MSFALVSRARIVAEQFSAKLMFDSGAGVCFWSMNDFAKDRFEYADDLAATEISSSTVALFDELIELFDQSIDWTDPGGSGPWREAEYSSFKRDVLLALDTLRKEVGETWAITADDLDSLGAESC